MTLNVCSCSHSTGHFIQPGCGCQLYPLPVALKNVSDKEDLIFPHSKHDTRDYSVAQSGNYKLTYNFTCMALNYVQQFMQDSVMLCDFPWFTAQITIEGKYTLSMKYHISQYDQIRQKIMFQTRFNLLKTKRKCLI